MNTFWFIIASLDCLIAIICGFNGQFPNAFLFLLCAFLASRGIKDTQEDK